jgi:rSAM/selenodomain-associated transferase 2
VTTVAADNRLSVIIPVLDEAGCIQATLESLQPLRSKGHEIIVVDGGSRDASISLSEPLVDHILQSSPGRATQMQAGTTVSSGDILWFLHADSNIPGHADSLITRSLADSKSDWGRFDITLDENHPLLRCVAWFMNQRTQLTGIATGDQGIFIRRALFDRIGGFPDVPLMEDIRISRSLKKHGRPCRVKARLGTSPRRWKTHGIARTILKMWSLRLAHFAGVSPERLARHYSVTGD